MKGAAEPLLAEAASPRAAGRGPVYVDWDSSVQWAIDSLLLALKALALVLVAPSKAVVVSLADSAVGLASMAALAAAERRRPDPQLFSECRTGCANPRPLILLACACLQALACLAVSQLAGAALYTGLAAGKAPPLVLSAVLLILLAGGAAARVAFRQHSASSALPRPAAPELLESSTGDWLPEACPAGAAPLEWDTNLAAMLAATALRFWPATAGWWVDPATAIAISLVLMGRWAAVARTQTAYEEQAERGQFLKAAQRLLAAEAGAAAAQHCEPACSMLASPQNKAGEHLPGQVAVHQAAPSAPPVHL